MKIWNGSYEKTKSFLALLSAIYRHLVQYRLCRLELWDGENVRSFSIECRRSRAIVADNKVLWLSSFSLRLQSRNVLEAFFIRWMLQCGHVIVEHSVTYDKMIFLLVLLKSPFSYYKSMLMLHSKYNFCSEEK